MLGNHVSLYYNVLPEWLSTGVKKFSLVLKKKNIW